MGESAQKRSRQNTNIRITDSWESLGQVKPLRWVGSSRSDVKSFPRAVRSEIGQALYAAQRGETDPAAKALKDLAGATFLRLSRPTTATPGALSTPCGLKTLFMYCMRSRRNQNRVSLHPRRKSTSFGSGLPMRCVITTKGRTES